MTDSKGSTIRLSENAKRRISEHGGFGESYEDVIMRILDEYDEMKLRESKKTKPS